MISSDGFLSNIVSKDQAYSQSILEISLLHRFLPQNDRKSMGPREPSLLLGSGFGLGCVVKCDIEESETVIPCRAYSQRGCVFAKIRGLEVDSNDSVTKVFLWVYGVNSPTRRIMENEGLFTNMQENTWYRKK
ncbi:hypothetical protein AVEN_101486-1 [Araneus ventricosus]|uniref:Uncharacterized protein n=1 Tax=Araneus ventricosus TaxID=182803 RepID=A0A4Y2K0Z6_ARAVE|nr:hypothetical protein AVEN_101486-1 [Araneus ventricosus]